MNSIFYTSSCKDHSCQLNINTKHHAIPSAYFSYDCRILYSYTINWSSSIISIYLTDVCCTEWKDKSVQALEMQGLQVCRWTLYYCHCHLYIKHLHLQTCTLLEKDSFHAPCSIGCHCSMIIKLAAREHSECPVKVKTCCTGFKASMTSSRPTRAEFDT